eukprot:675179-Rhodomonas_salina.1
MSGTDLVFAATRPMSARVQPAIGLRACYAVSVTKLAYAATSMPVPHIQTQPRQQLVHPMPGS